MAKEVVELMGIANVRMAYLGKIAQVNLQFFRVYKNVWNLPSSGGI